MRKYKPGDKVRFIDTKAHEDCPAFYPPIGTIGTVSRILKNGDLDVQWPTGSTTVDDRWYCPTRRVEPVEEGTANE